jgi:hypothetical protein
VASAVLLLLGACGAPESPPPAATARGRFLEARDVARGGDLARAERMLTDLARTVPDTEEGRLAAHYLRFEFPLFKASPRSF